MITGSLEEQASFIEGLLGIDEGLRARRGIDTNLVRGYGGIDADTGAVSTPLHLSTTFAHPSFDGSTGFMYSRCGNPTRLELENTIAMLEGGKKAWAYASGMTAISNLALLFSAGDHLVVSDDLYGGTFRLFETVFTRFGLSFSFVDFTDLEAVEQAIGPHTRALFAESPTNPTMKVVDLEAICNLAHDHDALAIVDNTLMTPYLQRPFAFGADIVVHSATKYLCGHNDVTAGFVVLRDESLIGPVFDLAMSEGGLLSPFDSWLMLRSLKTLGVRLERQQANARTIAAFLDGHPHVADVLYVGRPEHPGHGLMKRQASGFGAMLAFHVDTDERLLQVIERVQLILYAESLGGVESLITYPLMQTHGDMDPALRERLGINERLLRLSVGIEDVEDLVGDLRQALE